MVTISRHLVAKELFLGGRAAFASYSVIMPPGSAEFWIFMLKR
jgi:hypothetical protein